MRFHEYFEAVENHQGSSAHRHLKEEGFEDGIGCGWFGLLMGGKGAKIEVSVGESLLQKSARESGEVAEIEICERIIRQQVNG